MNFSKIIGLSFVLSIFVFTLVVISGVIEGVDVETIESLITSVDTNEYGTVISRTEEPKVEVEVVPQVEVVPPIEKNVYTANLSSTEDTVNFSVSYPSADKFIEDVNEGDEDAYFQLDKRNHIFLKIYPIDEEVNDDYMLSYNEKMREEGGRYIGTFDENIYSGYLGDELVYCNVIYDVNDIIGLNLRKYYWNVENNVYVLTVQNEKINEAYFDYILDQINIENFDMLVM